MVEEKRNPQEGSAPFNMAIATLMRVDKILQELAALSAMQFPDYSVYCQTKLKMIRQLYLAAVPLINDVEGKKGLKKCLKKADSFFGTKVHPNTRKRSLTCDENTDEKLDIIVEFIQETLQKEKYFMPPKDDPRFSWRQG